MHPIIHDGGPELLPFLTDLSTQSYSVLCLPLQVDDKHVLYSTNTPAVEKLLREAGLETTRPKLRGEVRYRDDRSLVWMGPTLFFSAAALTENPHLVSLALGVISNYLTDLFRGRAEPTAAHLEIVEEVEKGKRYRSVTYKGPVEGMAKAAAPIRATYGTKSEKP